MELGKLPGPVFSPEERKTVDKVISLLCEEIEDLRDDQDYYYRDLSKATYYQALIMHDLDLINKLRRSIEGEDQKGGPTCIED